MKRYSIQFIYLLLILTLSLSWNDAFAAKGVDCTDKAHLIESDARKCTYDEFTKADSELNRVYRAALLYIDEMARSHDANEDNTWGTAFRRSFISSQRAWVNFKEHYCGDVMEYLGWGGSGVAESQYSCKTLITRERIRQIKDDFPVQ